MEDGQYLGKLILAVQLMLVVHLYISPQWSLHIPTLGGSIEVVWAVTPGFVVSFTLAKKEVSSSSGKSTVSSSRKLAAAKLRLCIRRTVPSRRERP